MPNKILDLSKTEDLVKRLQEIRDKQRELAQFYRKKRYLTNARALDQSADKYQMVIDEIRYVAYGQPGSENYT